MSNIHDKAHGLEKAISESEEFQKLKSAFETVMKNPETKQMFDEFRDTQIRLQEKQMQGLEITEEEIETARKVVELVQRNQDISTLMEEEQKVNQLINDISRIITSPLEGLYGNSNNVN
ncbi:hypothetical protein CV093_07490 [Oceanobacillus sp. 143]|uniref:UPF0342 protein CUC15_07100 n=1 Tax=Oceanobacillus zhaokaii TaxID=2052660 RepID=A0A345PFB3_9BACI|nr:YlbF family regulator [Oceanobacillus zhaokaii]AXI08693.1 hypothetical protein CUC15_07100 [Oceanobacillus zhaokaii]QGS68448.1 hypothetical protein CV093_07490 [Oceanobacillus sp. 143]